MVTSLPTQQTDRPRAGLLVHIAAIVLIVASVSACARSALPDTPPSASHAYAAPWETPLGQRFQAPPDVADDASGFHLLTDGRTSYLARVMLAREARETLDLQYYIWDADATGLLLMALAVDAADRGVRVRVLLDDINLAASDQDLAVLAAHPNIALRIFNPAESRGARALDFLFDFSRMNRRMHNKVMIADNAVAVVGGRNIADSYFTVAEDANFRDLDLLAGGPIVRDLSALFDDFWNSRWAVPLSTFLDDNGPEAPPTDLAARLNRRSQDSQTRPFELAAARQEARQALDGVETELVWAPARVLADRPDKPITAHPGLLTDLVESGDAAAAEELLIEVAYFIPGEWGTDRLCALAARGVTVAVLTNSFTSNDVALAHAGYTEYRRDLLDCGVELFELRADAAMVEREWIWTSASSRASLHTKAAVIDRDRVFVGSFNMDPRSARLNTEIALLIESPRLAAQLAEHVREGMAPENAYGLVLHDGDVAWRTTAGDVLTTEPGTGPFSRFGLWLGRFLPIESLL